jgi:hypothetical protein
MKKISFKLLVLLLLVAEDGRGDPSMMEEGECLVTQEEGEEQIVMQEGGLVEEIVLLFLRKTNASA